MKTAIPNIGLAAYLKMRGYSIIGIEPRAFWFDLPDENSAHELQIEYYNSECRRHDVELCALRDMQRQVRD